MSEKVYTMKDYVEQTPVAILNNVENSKELTKQLVEAYFKKDYQRIIIVASGSSNNASMCAKPLMEKLLKKPVLVVAPFTFEHYFKELKDDDFIFVCSQSGRSTNAISTLKYLKTQQKETIGLTGNLDSPMKAYCDLLIEWGVGIETVSFVTKGVATLALFEMLFALEVALQKQIITNKQYEEYKEEMKLAAKAHEKLQEETNNYVETHKKQLLAMSNLYVLGANALEGVAKEAALKISETVKLQASNFEYEEFLHGPCYPMTSRSTILMYAVNDETYARVKAIYEGVKCVTDNVIMVGMGVEGEIACGINLSNEIAPLAALAVAPLLAQYPFYTLNTPKSPMFEQLNEIVSTKTDKRD